MNATLLATLLTVTNLLPSSSFLYPLAPHVLEGIYDPVATGFDLSKLSIEHQRIAFEYARSAVHLLAGECRLEMRPGLHKLLVKHFDGKREELAKEAIRALRNVIVHSQDFNVIRIAYHDAMKLTLDLPKDDRKEAARKIRRDRDEAVNNFFNASIGILGEIS